ncbi:LysR family transcriptional regulator [Paenalcaligenes niemegkensis]|uniref:LysR family transcriptional regulator n=1 Tax=Paenalcaligenes niemegkensis TaxID=2895469 RepID=UPI001EE93731|nr:LysR family transcriptional regulator [Paenalcaligenes niemegkensis]MCQ9615696.1 LysR family transcriptional regulator [Paenalcaligenes niemegkensis]
MKIPTLAAFRYFDVAAQTESFVKTGGRLHVTHSAVSRQVRALEEALGVKLFERRNRAVFLTPEGKKLRVVTASVFEQLESVVYRLQREARSNALVVSCEPTIAMRWLIPRLGKFYERHPEIMVHLMAAGGPIDFTKTGVDLAIRRDDFHWSDTVYGKKICDEWVGAVGLAGHKINETSLSGTRLLHTISRPTAWKRWAKRAGISIEGCERLDYEHFYLCIQAALAGLGMTVSSYLMVETEVVTGQLVAPYSFSKDGSSYFLLSPYPIESDIRATKFHEWLSIEANACISALV